MNPMQMKTAISSVKKVSDIRALLALLAGAVLCGCAQVEPLGIKPGTLGVFDPVAIREMSELASKNGTEPVDEDTVPGLIFVGRVTEYKPIQYEDIVPVYERQYLTYFESLQLDKEPSLSLGQFANTIGGFTKISLWRVNAILIGAQKVLYALVPNRLDDEIQFASPLDLAFWTGVGDLVAATTNDDGVLIIRRVLCRDGPDFSKCSRAYVKGLYDPLTGRMLDDYLEPMEVGPIINTSNYQVVDSLSGSDGQ